MSAATRALTTVQLPTDSSARSTRDGGRILRTGWTFRSRSERLLLNSVTLDCKLVGRIFAALLAAVTHIRSPALDPELTAIRYTREETAVSKLLC
jgi:hypothetical protein